MAKSGFTFRRGWEDQALATSGTRDLVKAMVERIARLAIQAAPHTPKRNWNKIRRNITTDTSKDGRGWFGNVVIEAHPKVRHAMLQERGWRDPRGRRHPGRRYLKLALERARRP
jgi:hypothetical protein